MTGSQEVPGVKVLGRPFKPVALGLTLNMIIVAQANIRGADRTIDYPLSYLMAAAAGAAVVLLIAGWFGRNQRLAELGLLATAGVYVTRAVFIALEAPFDQAVYFSVGAAVIAGGAFLLEALDHNNDNDGGR